MLSALKKSFGTILINPHIMLLSVVYLLIMSALIPAALFQTSGIFSLIIGILLLLFTGAFAAGWLGLIKCAVQYVEKEKTEEELDRKFYTFKESFFASVPKYMLSLILYFFLFVIFILCLTYLADKLFGKPDDIIKQLISVSNDYGALANFVATMPEESRILIFKRSCFLYAGSLLYTLFTFYSVPALYFGSSLNPIKGLYNGLIAFFKKPLMTIGAFLLIITIHVLLYFFELLAMKVQPLLFVALVLRIYFSVFVVVLIFSLYEKELSNHCNNGSDCFGENEACN